MKIEIVNALSNISKLTNDPLVEKELGVIYDSLLKKRSNCCNKKVYKTARGYICKKCNNHCDIKGENYEDSIHM